jgi:hypothetical protein
MKEIHIVTPQFDRTEELDYQPPETEEEFYAIINNAPVNILKGYGFRKWDSMNNIIKENISNKDKPTMVSLPTYSMEDLPNILDGKKVEPTGDTICDLSIKEPTPYELLDVDEDILLFPSEWYNIIPDKFSVTGLSGESYQFQKGVSDDDTRFGCLAYGIRRKIS